MTTRPFDTWLAALGAALDGTLPPGWQARWREDGPWHFVLAPGVAGEQAAYGTISAPADGSRPVVTLDAQTSLPRELVELVQAAREMRASLWWRAGALSLCPGLPSPHDFAMLADRRFAPAPRLN